VLVAGFLTRPTKESLKEAVEMESNGKNVVSVKDDKKKPVAASWLRAFKQTTKKARPNAPIVVKTVFYDFLICTIGIVHYRESALKAVGRAVKTGDVAGAGSEWGVLYLGAFRTWFKIFKEDGTGRFGRFVEEYVGKFD
jgi:hypothetical protein